MPVRISILLTVVAICAFARAEGKPLTPAEARTVVATAEVYCPPLQLEAFELAIIAEEKANPSGVIDLRRLHEAGALLAQARSDIKAAKKSEKRGLALFVKWQGHAMDLPFCSAMSEAKENAEGAPG
jgi:hypothetical protein